MPVADTNDLANKFPVFYKTSEYLQNKANFFRYSLPKIFDSDYNYELAERICNTAFVVSKNDWNEYFKKVNALISLSLNFLKLQIQLEKTGKYLYSNFKEVEENVYKSGEYSEGPDYLWGLYFSEIFWKIHQNFVKFFLQDFVDKNKDRGIILEVPSGSGFFLTEFLRANPKWLGIGLDIADTSIDISRAILNANGISQESYKIIKSNFFEYKINEKFDRIICGEFLEHLEDPLKVLQKLNECLKNDGRVFLTVAVWAAGIDHIYLYKSPSEVREHIQKAGFQIEHELVQPVFDKDVNKVEDGRIAASYATILTK